MSDLRELHETDLRDGKMYAELMSEQEFPRTLQLKGGAIFTRIIDAMLVEREKVQELERIGDKAISILSHSAGATEIVLEWYAARNATKEATNE